MLKEKLCTILIALLLFGPVGCTGRNARTGEQDPSSGEISILFINVGKADSILVRAAGKNYLIDTGEKSSAPQLFRALNLLGIDSLDAVFLTHTHSDHIGGMTVLAPNYRIETLYSAEISENKKDGGNKIMELAQELSLPHQRLKAGDRVEIAPNLSFEVLGPLVYNADDDNDNSLVLRLKANGRTLLFAGDMQFAEEESLMDAGVDVSADVLKVGNHGNVDATSDTFAAAVSPEYAVFTTDTSVDEDTASARVRSALGGAEQYITQDYECGLALTLSSDGSIEITSPSVPQPTARIVITGIDRDTQTVTIQNQGRRANMSGYFLFSEKGSEVFVFPKGSVLDSGESATISCQSNAADYFWQEDKIWKREDAGILYDKYGYLISRYEGTQ